jgi:hypothetical protein
MSANKKRSKLDKVSISILSAFILMTGTHLGCRYDVGAQLDKFFQEVSAETVLPEPQAQDPVAVSPVTAPSPEEEAANEAIEHPNIARNPFLVPVAARPVAAPSLPAPSTNAPSGNVPGTMNNLKGGAPAPIAPVAPAAPRVKGVITSGGQSVAIIEYNGHSGSYTIGQDIGGGYAVDDISGRTVSINGSSTSVGGRR